VGSAISFFIFITFKPSDEINQITKKGINKIH
jgi:hypothetical protein